MIEVKFTLLDEETDETKSDTVYIAGKPKGNIEILNLAVPIVSFTQMFRLLTMIYALYRRCQEEISYRQGGTL